MDDVVIAQSLHILSVVIWIGGVAIGNHGRTAGYFGVVMSAQTGFRCLKPLSGGSRGLRGSPRWSSG